MRQLLIVLIAFTMLSCNKTNEQLSSGFWIFESFDNRETGEQEIDTARHQLIVISFNESGEITINAIVNDCGGTYKVSNCFEVKELACTKMASVDSLDNVLENRFLEALTNSQTLHINNDKLSIQYNIDGDDKNELVFSKNNCAC